MPDKPELNVATIIARNVIINKIKTKLDEIIDNKDFQKLKKKFKKKKNIKNLKKLVNFFKDNIKGLSDKISQKDFNFMIQIKFFDKKNRCIFNNDLINKGDGKIINSLDNISIEDLLNKLKNGDYNPDSNTIAELGQILANKDKSWQPSILNIIDGSLIFSRYTPDTATVTYTQPPETFTTKDSTIVPIFQPGQNAITVSLCGSGGNAYNQKPPNDKNGSYTPGAGGSGAYIRATFKSYFNLITTVYNIKDIVTTFLNGKTTVVVTYTSTIEQLTLTITMTAERGSNGTNSSTGTDGVPTITNSNNTINQALYISNIILNSETTVRYIGKSYSASNTSTYTGAGDFNNKMTLTNSIYSITTFGGGNANKGFGSGYGVGGTPYTYRYETITGPPPEKPQRTIPIPNGSIKEGFGGFCQTQITTIL
jgi:hypothetical protein